LGGALAGSLGDGHIARDPRWRQLLIDDADIGVEILMKHFYNSRRRQFVTLTLSTACTKTGSTEPIGTVCYTCLSLPMTTMPSYTHLICQCCLF